MIEQVENPPTQVVPETWSDQRMHVLDETCWCDPYPDTVQPSVLIHRKENQA